MRRRQNASHVYQRAVVNGDVLNGDVRPSDPRPDVLGILYEQADGATQPLLSDESGYDPVTIGTMLKTMQRNELVKREPHPLDGRAKLVRITAGGKQTFRKLWCDSNLLRESSTGSLSHSQQKNAIKILSSITGAMDSFEV